LIADTRDKAPRGFTGSRGKEMQSGKAYAKNNAGFVPKSKGAGFKPGPISRNDLAVKASARKGSPGSTKKTWAGEPGGKAFGKSIASGKIGDKSLKSPARKLTRNDLALKAMSSDRDYKNGQKKVISSSASKNKAAPFKVGKASQPSVKNAYVKAVTKVKQPSRNKAVVRSSSRPVTTASPGKIKRPTYSKSKQAPVVKLTGRTQAAASRSKVSRSSPPRPKAAKPQAARQSKPQMRYQSSPQKSVKAAPQKSSKPTARSKSKQKSVK
jgi:hypothetical protein